MRKIRCRHSTIPEVPGARAYQLVEVLLYVGWVMLQLDKITGTFVRSPLTVLRSWSRARLSESTVAIGHWAWIQAHEYGMLYTWYLHYTVQRLLSSWYLVQRSRLCRRFVTTELVSLGRRISADTGCAGCRRVERTRTHNSQGNLMYPGSLGFYSLWIIPC